MLCIQEVLPLPPPRSSSSGGTSREPGQSRSRGKRSRHSGTAGGAHHETPATTSRSRDIHYPKYDYDYSKYGSSRDACGYQAKYGEDCHYGKYHHDEPRGERRSRRDRGGGGGGDHHGQQQQHHHHQAQQQGECSYNKTWPKQLPCHPGDDGGGHGGYTQDDHNVQYLQAVLSDGRPRFFTFSDSCSLKAMPLQ